MELILVTFNGRATTAENIGGFLRKFGPTNLPKNDTLRGLMGKMSFCVSGFDADPREIEIIPEVRAFYRQFFLEWPYWLFFCSLRNDTLRAMTLCCLDNLSIVQKDGCGLCQVEFDVRELGHHLLAAFPPMNWCCERAGMSEREIKRRSGDVFRYFNLKIH
jgi:hypothetical protein